MTEKVDSRELVLDLLIEILEKNGYSHLLLRQVLIKYQYLEKQDRAFISRLTEGTVENCIKIDYILNQFSKTKVKKMKPVVRNILRMGVYQIYFMDGVPDSAACNEAVKLAKRRKFHGLSGFVNGILRNISREQETISFPKREQNVCEYFSVQYSMPEWIVAEWFLQYGEIVTEEILKTFLEDSLTCVRCNKQKASVEEIIDNLESEGIYVKKSIYLDYVLYIGHYDYLEKVNAFAKGWITVQDLSSCLVGEVAEVKSGDYIIDVCAAPGGKALHIADQLEGTGHVEARDLTETKVELIKENIRRIGLNNIEAILQDALVFDKDSVKKADIVIADLPCSGLGIIGRKADIKYNITPEKQRSLVELQREMLSTIYDYVKPGGTLIYSTCTINIEENQENMAWFLEQYSFEPVPLTGRLGKNLNDFSMKEGWLQLLPGVHHSDGFFLAVMKRIG